MRILILGGTKFLGRAVVEAARARKHKLTLFNRGQQDPGAFPGVERLRGDRTLPVTDPAGLGALAGRTWDAVIDTAAYLPRDVRAVTSALAGRTGHYTLVSSVSVLASAAVSGQSEESPVARLTDEQRVEMDAIPIGGTLTAARLGELYGPLKALCEDEARQAFGDHTLIVRPGLIVGPYDPTDRFTYWPVRMMRGGEVLAPGRPERRVSFIDVRDIAEWMVRQVERGQGGTTMAVGPEPPISMGEVLGACARVAESRGAPGSRLVWVRDEWLLERKVGPWMEMPLWVPESDPEHAGFMQEDYSKARAAGLTYRALEETIRATLDWYAGRAPVARGPAGLAAERERELLAGWSRGVA
jgi:2'-hydroxyisoflavone reductase